MIRKYECTIKERIMKHYTEYILVLRCIGTICSKMLGNFEASKVEVKQ